MAKNFIQPGKVVTVTAPAAVTSGDFVFIADGLYGVATHDAASGAELELETEGVFDLPKDATITMSEGDRLFWDPGNSHLDKTATAQTNVASCVKDALAADTTVRAKLGATTPAGT